MAQEGSDVDHQFTSKRNSKTRGSFVRDTTQILFPHGRSPSCQNRVFQKRTGALHQSQLATRTYRESKQVRVQHYSAGHAKATPQEASRPSRTPTHPRTHTEVEATQEEGITINRVSIRNRCVESVSTSPCTESNALGGGRARSKGTTVSAEAVQGEMAAQSHSPHFFLLQARLQPGT